MGGIQIDIGNGVAVVVSDGAVTASAVADGQRKLAAVYTDVVRGERETFLRESAEVRKLADLERRRDAAAQAGRNAEESATDATARRVAALEAGDADGLAAAQASLFAARAASGAQAELVGELDRLVSRARAAAEAAWMERPEQIRERMETEVRKRLDASLPELQALTEQMRRHAADVALLDLLVQASPGMHRLRRLFDQAAPKLAESVA